MEKTKTKKRLLLFVLSVLSGFALSSIDYFKNPEFNWLIQTSTISQPEAKIHPSERYKYALVNSKDKTIHLKPNTQKDLELKIKNIGKLSWNIQSETPAISIDPNETFAAKFSVKAPASPGFYSKIIKPIVADSDWKTNNNMNLSIIVDGDFNKSYQYELVDEKPLKLMSNVSRQVTLKIKNIGTATWYDHGKFALQLLATKIDNSWLEEEIVATMSEPEIVPGQTATFNFNITAPAFIADYELKFGLAVKDNYIFENPFVLGINVATKKVAITIDDGYGNIDAFIDTLNRENVRATFFMLGCVAEKSTGAMRRIVTEGHQLASHSYCHPDFRTLSDDEVRWQLNHTRDVMKDVTGKDVYPYFRYPYGAMNERTNAILKEEGWKYFPWTQSTGDYKFHENSAAGRQQIYYYSTLNPPDNAIILMHVISKSSLAVLPDIIQWYRDHDYNFVTVDEL